MQGALFFVLLTPIVVHIPTGSAMLCETLESAPEATILGGDVRIWRR